MKQDKVKYVRVSTLGQKIDRQLNFKGIIISDKCSGAIAFEDRNGGKKVLEMVRAGKIKELHVHSLSRLGRDLLDILKTIRELTAQGCPLIIENEGIRTLDASGNESITSKLLISILAALAETERSLLKERQLEGIAIAKRQGRYKGRPKGTGMTPEELIKKHPKTARELRLGESLRRAARLGNVSLNTAQRVKAALQQCDLTIKS